MNRCENCGVNISNGRSNRNTCSNRCRQALKNRKVDGELPAWDRPLRIRPKYIQDELSSRAVRLSVAAKDYPTFDEKAQKQYQRAVNRLKRDLKDVDFTGGTHGPAVEFHMERIEAAVPSRV